MDLGCPDDALIKAETIEKLTVGNFLIFSEIRNVFNLCFFVKYFLTKEATQRVPCSNYSSVSIPNCSESKYSRSSCSLLHCNESV